MIGDTCQFNACNIATTADGSQGSRSSQIKLDKAIATCSYFAYAYKVKSIPFLKRGYFIEWKRLMDLAVEYDPVGQLGYRGWCRYQFLRDYNGAIKDFEALGELQNDLGYSANGTYHLNIAKAVCQDAIGNHELALETILSSLSDSTYYVGPYDYLHLGMIYLHLNLSDKAVHALEIQLEQEVNADTHYYLAQAYSNLSKYDLAETNLEESDRLYKLNNFRSDPYSETEGRIYQEDIDQLKTRIGSSKVTSMSK